MTSLEKISDFNEYIFTTDILRQTPDYVLIPLAIIGYAIGAIFYSIIQHYAAGKLLNKQFILFGNLSRVTHIICYMFLGYIFHNKFILIMVLGIGWELVECTLRYIRRDKYWGEGSDHISDIFANALGFLIGYAIYHSSTSLSTSVREIDCVPSLSL